MGGGNRGNIFTERTKTDVNNFTVKMRSDGRRTFFQHDDREPNYTSQNSSGSGYNNNRSRNNRGDSWQNRSNQSERGNWRGSRRGQRGNTWRRGSSRKFLNKDDDVNMSSDKGSNHQHFYKSNRGRKLTRNSYYSGRPNNMCINNNSGWQKVTILNVGMDMKEEVMAELKDNVDALFTPILFEQEDKNVVFYLEKQYHIAKAIITLSDRIVLTNGRKMKMICSDTTPPNRSLTSSQMTIILKVMSNRYNVEMKHLDLKNFHNDPTFIQELIFCPLRRDSQILAVLDIVVKNISNVEEIDFSNNQLSNLNQFESLKECLHLRCLNLENNKLRTIESLSAVKYLPIEELNLTGNLYKDRNQKSYRAQVFFIYFI